MKPDRSNYEIWFIDWIDGKLSDQQEQELKLFFSENPDLREELESLSLMNLKADESIFAGKGQLLKSVDCYSSEQFEHLCIADLENDLPPDQKAELMEIISRDDQKRKTFDLVSRLKLTPPKLTFTKKSSVKKLTTGQKIIRLSAIGLSVAATVTILMIVWLATPSKIKEADTQIAGNTKQDTIIIRAITSFKKMDPVPSRKATKQTPGNSETRILKAVPVPASLQADLPATAGNPDSIVNFRKAEEINRLTVEASGELVFGDRPSTNRLMVSRSAPLPPFFDDGRSNVERFLAKFFREKIMHDTVSVNKPVETFEIAEAGIAGLNRLFGLQMALHKNTDQNGDVKSYSFSSRLLKLNAPIKKTGKEL